MGYNFFVDRWTAACNWTPSTAGGKCGLGATAGDCYGVGTPSNAIGVDGNIFYSTNDGVCSFKRSGAWYGPFTTGVAPSDLSSMYTIDPGSNGNSHRPPYVGLYQANASAVCQGTVDTYYGNKRLPRRREYIAYAAWSSIPGEPNYLGDDVIKNLEMGYALGHGPGSYSCNAGNHSGISATAFNTSSNLAGDLTDVVKSFNIGSIETSKCVSRYGVQDHVGNVWQWTSDQFTPSSTLHISVGKTSSIDSGNASTAGFDLYNFYFDGVQGPGSVSAGQVATTYTSEWVIQNGTSGGSGATQGFGAAYFNTTLGIPLVGNDTGNAVPISSFSSKLHDDYIWLYSDTAGTILSGGSWNNGSGDGRWTSLWGGSWGGAMSVRCVLPAE